MLDPDIDKARRSGAERLGSQYAHGALSTGTFELRLEAALEAGSSRAVQELLWDVAPAAAGARVDGLAAVDGDRRRLESAELRSVWTVGRAGACDLQLDDPHASRQHARVVKRGHAWTVEDLNSRNGTYLNGTRVDRAVLLPGDLISAGGDRVHLRVEGHMPFWTALHWKLTGARPPWPA